jgi:hypothetical protein
LVSRLFDVIHLKFYLSPRPFQGVSIFADNKNKRQYQLIDIVDSRLGIDLWVNKKSRETSLMALFVYN